MRRRRCCRARALTGVLAGQRVMWTRAPGSVYPVAMTVDAISRDPATGTRAGGGPATMAPDKAAHGGRVDGARQPRATVEMIGVKWHATRHGDLRRRLRAAVARDGFDSAADWLSDALTRRESELSPASAAHPLAG